MTWRPTKMLRAVRRVIMRAQGFICPICAEIIAPFVQGDASPTLDHVLPRARGGMDAVGNLLVTHKLCNNRRGDDLPTGCLLIWVTAVNCRLGVQPDRWAV